MKRKDEILLVFNVRNLNGRIYRVEDFTKDLERFKGKSSELESYSILGDLENACKERFGLLGEFGHQDKDENYIFPDNLEIALYHTSHKIDNIRIEGDKLLGDIEVLDTKAGIILKENIDDVVFRPRGVGSVGEGGIVELQKIYTFDAISKVNDSYKDILDESN